MAGKGAGEEGCPMVEGAAIASLDISHLDEVFQVINDAARRYAGHIPPTAYHDRYMPWEELLEQARRMEFFDWEEERALLGTIDHERVQDVTLIRLDYVRTAAQRQGTGTRLLGHLAERTETPWLLIGTWAGAT